ncbi:extracellular solute-binding protein [Micrococcales bacterium 31B]|nr:extracellular solute-binding protein [Micrococcales bacterium 31B]
MSAEVNFSRRKLFAGASLAALGAAGLSGCAQITPNVNAKPTIAPATGPVKLTYWAWLKDLQKTLDVWNAQNPNIQVEAVWIPGGDGGGYSKMLSAVAAGGGPDIGQIEMRTLPQFVLNNSLVDLSRYGFNEYKDQFDPVLWGQCSLAGGVFGAPQDSGPVAFYYRHDLFDQMGAQPPATWVEWAEVAKEFKTLSKGGKLEVFNVSDASLLCSYATQAGANWTQPEGDEWIINLLDEGTLEVAEFFDKALTDDLLDTTMGAFSPGWTAAVLDGKIGALTSASWADALIEVAEATSGKWKVAPMQKWSQGFGSTYLGGSTAAVMANSQHPYEAAQFLGWLGTSHEAVDAMIDFNGIGWSPAKDYVGAKRQKPSEFFSGQNYNEEVFAKMAQDQNTSWAWPPVLKEVFNLLQDGFRLKLSENKSLMATLEDVQPQVVKILQDKGLKARSAA